MSSSESPAATEARGGPRVNPVAQRFTMPAALSAALDHLIAQQPEPRPTRPEAIRMLLQEALAAKASITPADAQSAIASRIEVLEARVASIPEHGEPSPETGMNTMKRALAEAELTGLRQRRGRGRRAGSDAAR